VIDVTITGADDAVDPQDLLNLSREFPFVEWGILLSRSRERTPRYPSLEWVANAGDLWALARPRPRCAIHLCGEAARDAMVGRMTWGTEAACLLPKRVQVNGYIPANTFGLRMIARHLFVSFVLQARSSGDLPRCALDAIEIGNVSVLYDPSGGRGVETNSWWAAPGAVRPGFAGGIGPSNVRQAVEGIRGYLNDCALDVDNFWIDMESGVRDENGWFDLGRVRQVLEHVASIRGEASQP
jgi:hypothetical protein